VSTQVVEPKPEALLLDVAEQLVQLAIALSTIARVLHEKAEAC